MRRLRRAAIVAAAGRLWRPPTGAVAVIVQVPIHARLYRPIGALLRQRGTGESVLMGTDGFLTDQGIVDLDIRRQLSPTLLPALAALSYRTRRLSGCASRGGGRR